MSKYFVSYHNVSFILFRKIMFCNNLRLWPQKIEISFSQKISRFMGAGKSAQVDAFLVYFTDVLV